MIRVSVEGARMTIKGHAGYGAYGKDIVCSAVSVLTQFVGEIIEKEKIGSYKIMENTIQLDFDPDNVISLKLQNYLLEAFKNIETDYKKNMKVEVSS